MNAQITHRTRLVSGGLAALWVLIVIWQVLEHLRVNGAARAELGNRAKDISNTLGVVLRSQRRFGGLISRERIESALNSLIKPGELNSIALLNASEEVVASAGDPINFSLRELVPSAEYWGEHTVALMNLVDLGTNVTSETDPRNATIVLPRGEMPAPFGTNRPPSRSPDDREDNGPSAPASDAVAPAPNPLAIASTNPVRASLTNALENPAGTNDGTNGNSRTRGRARRGDGRSPFGRPFWMSEEEYRSLLQRKGVHSFVLVLSTRSMQTASHQDLWGRGVISAFAAVAAVAFGLAWRNLTRSSELEVRLARAAELNVRLKEMNLAAAGLAHETRNPLNIIRGLAQLISRQHDASAETHSKSRDIIAETDRVTAQLNEFINYSRPRDVRWSTVPLNSVVSEVVRALTSDLEERGIRFQVAPDLAFIEGDEQLVRQALFNLLINAIQAVEHGGAIEVVGERQDANLYSLEIRDDGGGVAPEHRSEIFKPYFTTHSEGTGLGLAVVQQIVLAHGWDIDFRPNVPKGAVFRISRMKTIAHP